MAFHSQNAYKNHVQHIPRLWVCHPGVICRSWPSKKRRQRGDMCYDDRLWGEAGLTKYWEYYIQHNSSFNTICVYTLLLHFIWFFASICLLCLPMLFLKSGSTSTSVQDLANVGLGGGISIDLATSLSGGNVFATVSPKANNQPPGRERVAHRSHKASRKWRRHQRLQRFWQDIFGNLAEWPM